MLKRYFLLLLFFPLTCSIAQQVSNVRAESKGDVIYVFYDLKGSMDNQKYKISLYSSHNQLEEPVALVSGNIGDTITAGNDKRIEWQAKNELSRYNGEISFEVQATLVYSPLAMSASQVSKTYKRAKAHTFSWRGGVVNEKIRLELFNGNTRVAQTEDIANKKQYKLTIPAHARPGDKYRLKVTTVNHPDNYTLSNTFSVKRRFSWPVKLIPVAAAGIAYLLIEQPWVPDRTLPGPPGLPKEQ
ncbi:hypothetical protein GXP67_25985 [Rhodocytophaga rosea]|uniref:DUF2207 domain-containing protein n=1 Tax=Rhodocytophaga rosea TaxID=2704465 RepID=A0A6C0GQS1_9BACT|nr:hypothetical protein [Rhodocytophaga rosea]QHT69850.1 hypothetical protein GXP67_25985 [Rhodocytophaga rosea]